MGVCVHVWIRWKFVSSAASFTYFGELTKCYTVGWRGCPDERIVTITKVYIARNNIHVEIIRFHVYKLATLLTFETLKWKYTFATNVIIVTRDESPLAYRAPDASEHSNFGTCHIGTSTIRDCTTALFQVTKYRQFARKVGTSTSLNAPDVTDPRC